MRHHAVPLCLFTGLFAGAQCTVDLPQDTVTIYHGYQPLSCVDLEPIGTGDGTLAYTWSNGAGTPDITVCDTIGAWYSVVLSDSANCIAADSIYVNVVDVRCGAQGQKVRVCHIPPGDPDNAHPICIGASAVPAHLAHGCVLGECPADPEDLQLQVGPNPISDEALITMSSGTSQSVTLSSIGPAGQGLGLIYSGTLTAGIPHSITWNVNDLQGHANIVWLKLQGVELTVIKSVVILAR